MCGRYATTRSEADLTDLFDTVTVAETPPPSWNVAPTDPVPLVRMSQRRGGRVLDTARWGLVPPWATDPRGGARMINARAETVATSPAFAPSFARRRCLIPADGWFEWLRTGSRKQAYYLTPADGSVLAFAGIWSVWGPQSLLTCSVVTTAAAGGLARVHDRMPLVLPRERWSDWLGTRSSPSGRSSTAVAPGAVGGDSGTGRGEFGAGGGDFGAGGRDPGWLLAPMSADELAAIDVRPVGAAVGNVRNNGPHLLDPPAATTLF